VTGANDGLRGIDPTLISANLRRIIQVLKKNKVIVVLGGMKMVSNLGAAYTAEFEKIYPAVARAEDVILVPFVLSGVAADPELNQTDGIHPTAAGYRLIVENLFPYVAAAIDAHRRQ
jgi:acyl-CoA thioesterase-1